MWKLTTAIITSPTVRTTYGDKPFLCGNGLT